MSRVLPRLLHQIWLGEAPFPERFQAYQATWLEHHPGWVLRFWTEENLPADLARTEVYERLRQPAERADILRIEVLHREGGVYVDTDFECLRPLDPLLDGVELFCAELRPGRVNNAIIGAVASHPTLARALRELRPREYCGYDKEATGPAFLNRLVQETGDFTVFPPELFYPRTPAERSGAFAVHHQARSWKDAELLHKDVERAEQKLARTRDELEQAQQEILRLRREAPLVDRLALLGRRIAGRAAGELRRAPRRPS